MTATVYVCVGLLVGIAVMVQLLRNMLEPCDNFSDSLLSVWTSALFGVMAGVSWVVVLPMLGVTWLARGLILKDWRLQKRRA